MNRRVNLAAALLIAAAQAGAQMTVWTPPAGTLIVTPLFARQTFRKTWRGQTPSSVRSPVTQSTGGVNADLGLARNLALDVTAGYSNVNSTAFGGVERSDGGMTDTRFGVRWTAVPGTRHRPALGVRVGGIVRGTYQPNYPFSAGDGGSGVETSLLGGHVFGESGFAAYSDIGYRYRNHRIPPDLFGSAGVQKSLRHLNFGFAYRQGRGLGGPNLGDRGFTYPRVREIRHMIEGSAGVTRGSRGYYVFVAQTVAGRNTGKALIVGGAAQFGLRLPWWH